TIVQDRNSLQKHVEGGGGAQCLRTLIQGAGEPVNVVVLGENEEVLVVAYGLARGIESRDHARGVQTANCEAQRNGKHRIGASLFEHGFAVPPVRLLSQEEEVRIDRMHLVK